MSAELHTYRHVRYAFAARGREPQLADYRPLAKGSPCACPQTPFRMDFLIDTSERLPQSEDCHFLTIYTPAEEGECLPVVVWFHGGAYLTGSGESALYDASTLAQEGHIVVVSISYRWGLSAIYMTKPTGWSISD